jgi:hypothetical protein
MPRGLRRMLEALGVLSELKVKSGKSKVGLSSLSRFTVHGAKMRGKGINRNPKGRFAETQRTQRNENGNTARRRNTESRKSVLYLYLYHTEVVNRRDSNLGETITIPYRM